MSCVLWRLCLELNFKVFLRKKEEAQLKFLPNLAACFSEIFY